jgi:hypothetical protein
MNFSFPSGSTPHPSAALTPSPQGEGFTAGEEGMERPYIEHTYCEEEQRDSDCHGPAGATFPSRGRLKNAVNVAQSYSSPPHHLAEIRFGTFPRIPAGTANSRLPKNFIVKIFYFEIFNAHATGRASPQGDGLCRKQAGLHRRRICALMFREDSY